MSKIKLGVPCSQLKGFIKDAEIPCTDESEAMAIASGVWLAGGEPVVYMQNSGLGHIIDIVTSLYKPYKIPLPHLILSLRYKPYHHSYMAKITKDLLKLLEYTDVEIIEQNEKN